ncbi:ABC transporter ATP-binding protein [Amantichitinum ursilacus]|uniref:Aliphatic sulfonates import ATP-binding protein SsuB n=1 Tax=Amantichitinum ursilacus TaxID=857265 RepID=A0A0N0XID1_9NEIS|nr:ABC transporter ATP-binding protein [Amantichitinum ursilacus]KPC49612.1 Aliphatic sulfonates import ATP-binding protein SsuB [Amantichitinum ursilacus]
MNAPVPINTARQARGALSVIGINKQFGDGKAALTVLQDINLHIKPGEFVAIVGASGCGKSTLLRLLAGLDTEFDGVLLHDGEPLRGASAQRGLVFQDHRLLPWLTVRQNIDLALLNAGLDATTRQQRIAAGVEQVGLTAFIDAWPHQLSGGMAQRAAIARALAARPQVLLLDEPLGALDALTRLKLQQELRRLWQEEGITMVMVTHDIEEALYLADRVIVLDARPGRIRKEVRVELPHPRSRNGLTFVALRDSLLADFTGEHATEAPPPEPHQQWRGSDWLQRMSW